MKQRVWFLPFDKYLIRALWVVFVFTQVVLGASCLPHGDSVDEDGTIVDVTPPDAGTIDPDKIVCDPFVEGETQGNRNQGILGQLFYRDDGQPRWYSALEYIEKGVQAEVSLYFNRISIPTRPFDRGFVTQNGQVITTDGGDTLYEYFALALETQLQLGEGDRPGWYELALLSDDGAMLWAQNSSGEWELMIDNDGDHPTRMGCAAKLIYIGQGERVPVRIKYYQGPRYHIALNLMWRLHGEGNVTESECGRSGNDRYWDYNQDPPMPTLTFTQLLGRGWGVLSDTNYVLPNDVGENPCNSLPAPTIGEIRTPDIGFNHFEVTWTTDIVSSSQVFYTNTVTNETFTTEVNKEMLTSHRQIVMGLAANTLYEFSVRSISGSGKVSESPSIRIKTLR